MFCLYAVTPMQSSASHQDRVYLDKLLKSVRHPEVVVDSLNLSFHEPVLLYVLYFFTSYTSLLIYLLDHDRPTGYVSSPLPED